MRDLQWAYGITTVPERAKNGLLARTLTSLHGAGFENPRLFVDDGIPPMRTFGRWATALWELLIREPTAHFYALFQDDVVAVKGLRYYLESSLSFSKKKYYNLYTCQFYTSQVSDKGWFVPRPCLGRGALGLVFTRDCVIDLLSSRSFVQKPLEPNRGWRSVDGAVVEALVNQRPDSPWLEAVHNPSLLQHTGGKDSAMMVPEFGWGPKQWNGLDLAPSFPGEEYDACSLLK